MGLAAAWLPGEKDARAGPEQGKRLVLGHASNPSAFPTKIYSRIRDATRERIAS
jgi:hypothetical protein